MNSDIIGEIAKHATYFALSRLAICSRMCQTAKDKAHAIKHRRVVRFIAKLWLNKTKMAPGLRWDSMLSGEDFARRNKLLCPTVGSGSEYGLLEMTVQNIVMIAIYLPEWVKEDVIIQVIANMTIISSFRHKVIPGFPIYHTLVYGVFPALRVDGNVIVRVFGCTTGEVAPSKLVSYSFADGRGHDIFTIKYGPFAIFQAEVIMLRYDPIRNDKRFLPAGIPIALQSSLFP